MQHVVSSDIGNIFIFPLPSEFYKIMIKLKAMFLLFHFFAHFNIPLYVSPAVMLQKY